MVQGHLQKQTGIDGLKKNGLEYVALPDLEHEVYKYVKNGKRGML